MANAKSTGQVQKKRQKARGKEAAEVLGGTMKLINHGRTEVPQDRLMIEQIICTDCQAQNF